MKFAYFIPQPIVLSLKSVLLRYYYYLKLQLFWWGEFSCRSHRITLILFKFSQKTAFHPLYLLTGKNGGAIRDADIGCAAKCAYGQYQRCDRSRRNCAKVIYRFCLALFWPKRIQVHVTDTAPQGVLLLIKLLSPLPWKKRRHNPSQGQLQPWAQIKPLLLYLLSLLANVSRQIG